MRRKPPVQRGRDRIDELERMKTEFLAIASHKLRTPLATVKNALGLVSDGSAGPLNEDQRKFLRIADRNVDKLAVLINDFFLLSDLESGYVELLKAEVDINELIEGALAAFSRPAKACGISLRFEPDKTLDKVDADEYKIVQALNNLISNAVKFSRKGGTVTVTASMHSRDKDFIQVSVKDAGIGIAKEYFDRIFDRFQQIDTALTRKFSGSGLGLAICKRIIELHKGKVWLESELNKGSTFHFILPIKRRGPSSRTAIDK